MLMACRQAVLRADIIGIEIADDHFFIFLLGQKRSGALEPLAPAHQYEKKYEYAQDYYPVTRITHIHPPLLLQPDPAFGVSRCNSFPAVKTGEFINITASNINFFYYFSAYRVKDPYWFAPCPVMMLIDPGAGMAV